jgi:ketosteroid isomerase-like protein
VENKDHGAFAAFLDEDTRFVSQSVLRGSTAVTEAWSVFFTESGPELVWRPYIVEVAATGDLALSRGPYRARALNEAGEVVESWGIYNSVWRKAPGGAWKIIFDAGNAGENQVTEELKALIDLPVENCEF